MAFTQSPSVSNNPKIPTYYLTSWQSSACSLTKFDWVVWVFDKEEVHSLALRKTCPQGAYVSYLIPTLTGGHSSKVSKLSQLTIVQPNPAQHFTFYGSSGNCWAEASLLFTELSFWQTRVIFLLIVRTENFIFLIRQTFILSTNGWHYIFVRSSVQGISSRQDLACFAAAITNCKHLLKQG